jgi:hypothetical protein
LLRVEGLLLRVERLLFRARGLRRASGYALLAATLEAVACSSGPDAPAARAPGSGTVSIAGGMLGAIERERGVTRQEALELASEDALLALGLREREPLVARWVERTALARTVLSALVEEARAGGPPTDEEVEAITQARFWELARPRMVQVTHAVVLSSEENEEARALAQQIAAATREAKTFAQFQAAAQGVPTGNLKVKVENLSPVAPDGRAVDPAAPPPAGPGVQRFDADFSAAAQRLVSPGDQSPVVRTPFGYHVIYLISVIEPKQPSLDERRALLHDEIMTQRAQALSSALLAEKRRELMPEQERSALASMGQISVAHGDGPR